MSQQDNEYMTPEEASERLGVSTRTLERYAKEGLLKKYRRKIRREVFYKKSEVEDLLKIQPEEDLNEK